MEARPWTPVDWGHRPDRHRPSGRRASHRPPGTAHGLTRSENARRLGVTTAVITKILKRSVVGAVLGVVVRDGRAGRAEPLSGPTDESR